MRMCTHHSALPLHPNHFINTRRKYLYYTQVFWKQIYKHQVQSKGENSRSKELDWEEKKACNNFLKLV